MKEKIKEHTETIILVFLTAVLTLLAIAFGSMFWEEVEIWKIYT